MVYFFAQIILPWFVPFLSFHERSWAMVYVLIFCWVVDLERQNGDPGCKISSDLYVQKAQIANFQFHFEHFGLRTSMKRQKVGWSFNGRLHDFRRPVRKERWSARWDHQGALRSSCCTVHAFMPRTNGYGRSLGKGWTHWARDGVGEHHLKRIEHTGAHAKYKNIVLNTYRHRFTYGTSFYDSTPQIGNASLWWVVVVVVLGGEEGGPGTWSVYYADRYRYRKNIDVTCNWKYIYITYLYLCWYCFTFIDLCLHSLVYFCFPTHDKIYTICTCICCVQMIGVNEIQVWKIHLCRALKVDISNIFSIYFQFFQDLLSGIFRGPQ